MFDDIVAKHLEVRADRKEIELSSENNFILLNSIRSDVFKKFRTLFRNMLEDRMFTMAQKFSEVKGYKNLILFLSYLRRTNSSLTSLSFLTPF